MVFVPEAKCMCSTCIEHRTSAVRNTQETGWNFSFIPPKAVGHVSTCVGSTSTTPPPAIAPCSSTMSRFPLPPNPWGAVAPPQAPAFGTPTPPAGFGTPVSSTSVSSTKQTAPILGTMQAPVQATSAWSTTITSSTLSSVPRTSPFGTSPAVTLFSAASTQSPKPFGFPLQASSAVAADHIPSLFSSYLDSTSPFRPPPAVTSFSSASAQSPFGCGSFAAPSPFQSSSSAFAGHTPSFNIAPVQDSGKPASVSPFGNGIATTSGNVPSMFAPSTSKSPFSSSFPPFGDSYLPGTGANSLRSSPFTGGGRTVSAGQSTFTGIPSGGFNYGACRSSGEGSRHTRYAPTPDYLDPAGNLMFSISASEAYRHKSHEELRWEDYRNGDKGDSHPAAHISPIGSVSHSTFASDAGKLEELRCEAYKQRETGVLRANTTFTPSTVSPSLFQPQRTTQGNMFTYLPTGPSNVLPTSSSTPSTTVPTAHVTSSVQRPHETNDVSSSHTSGCTACGAASSPSPSGYSIFNGPATPTPFFSNGGYFPMMFGGMAPAFQAYPMMFGTNLPGQGTTTPAMQAHPVQGFLLLPFAAMNLQ